MAADTHAHAHGKPWHREDGKGFVNPWPSFIDHGFFGAGRMLMDWDRKPLPPPTELTPHVPIDKARLANPAKDALQLTWLGHASFLLQVNGFNILFDPIFSDRCSPSQIIGPKRITPPACQVADLPPIHAVVISHNHYDHLDENTVRALGNTPRYFVPLGVKAWFTSAGITNVVEADWWDSNGLGPGVDIVCTPCQHFSGRTLTDRNRTLWASWVVAATTSGGDPQRFFFGGDTAYRAVPKGADEHAVPTCPAFKEIGDRYGPFDLACIPIGAYSPRWFMSCVHCSPEDAVCVHLDVRSKRTIGMHWGTFVLTDEDVREPPKRLRAEVERRGLPLTEFTVMSIGETLAEGGHAGTGTATA